MNLTKATIVADSISQHNNRLTTFRLTYPRIILSEFNTHRLFCLDEDSKIEFETFESFEIITIKDFVYNWYESKRYSKNLTIKVRQLNEATNEFQLANVSNCYYSGQKEVFKVTAGNFSITGSKDHRLFTLNGWKVISDLIIYSDSLIVNDDKSIGTPIKIDSITSVGIRNTYDLEINGEFPNFLANGIVVHNSRNTSSSRAIPVKDNILRVKENPFIPEQWVKNKKGMYSFDILNNITELEKLWIDAAQSACDFAEELSKNELHKQYANRLIEPFMYVDTIVSATDFDNFFHLRISSDAQPEIQELATLMYEEYIKSIPILLKEGEWHLPYIETKVLDNITKYFIDEVEIDSLEQAIKLSVSCSGQVSYRRLNTSIDKALEIYDKFVSGDKIHACFDEDTELLTKSGWIKCKDYDGFDQIGIVIPGTHDLYFESPFTYHKYDDVKKLVHIIGENLDLLTTLNHRHYVAKHTISGWQSFNIETASDLYRFQKFRRYLKTANYTSCGVDYPLNYCLLGMYLVDGIEKHEDVEFYLNNQSIIDYLNSIDPYLVSIGNGQFRLSNKCGNWLNDNCRTLTNEKKLPNDFINLSSNQWKLLKEGLLNANGYLNHHPTFIFNTYSSVLATQLQLLAHIHGDTCSIIRTGKLNKLTFTINLLSDEQYDVNTNMEIVDYNKSVYCPTVSSGLVLVRRNEKITVSGNSCLEHIATPFSDYDYSLKQDCINYMGAHLEEPISEYDLDKFLYIRNFKGWTQYRTYIKNETFTDTFKK